MLVFIQEGGESSEKRKELRYEASDSGSKEKEGKGHSRKESDGVPHNHKHIFYVCMHGCYYSRVSPNGRPSPIRLRSANHHKRSRDNCERFGILGGKRRQTNLAIQVIPSIRDSYP